jgi:beta-glucanase (GH16 family)
MIAWALEWAMVAAVLGGPALLGCSPSTSGPGGALSSSGGATSGGPGGQDASGTGARGGGGAARDGGGGGLDAVMRDGPQPTSFDAADAASPTSPDGAKSPDGADDVGAVEIDAQNRDTDTDGAGPGAGWKLVWSDEFDQPTACPDPANWGYEHGLVRNNELQFYQPDNASCQDGLLTIEARREKIQTSSYSSTSMITSGKHAFTYGRFETRARIPTDQGSWPAFWTLGIGGWPQSGEVDIMEYYKNTVLANVCKPAGGTCGWSSVRQTLASLGGAAWTSQFHVWAMEWDAQNIDLFLDGKLVNHFPVAQAVATGQMNPYIDRPMYIILNLAIGGDNGGDPANTVFPLRFEVDYVRVYQRTN